MPNRRDDPGSPSTSPTESSHSLGSRIRAVRHGKGMSIRDLAERSNVSTGLISQVERGVNDPSLQTARAIAKALETPLFDLFQDPDPSRVAVVRANRRMVLRSPHGDLTYQRVSPGAGALEVLEGRLEPGTASSDAPWSHPSEECVVVLDGGLTVEVGADSYVLAPGDSCYYDSRRPHRYVNRGTAPVRFLIAITPPSY